MSQAVQSFGRNLARFTYSTISAALGMVLLVLLWWYTPAIIVSIMDTNLAWMALFCALFPPPWNAQIETALRMGLGADKALLFAESALAVRFLLGGISFLASKSK